MELNMLQITELLMNKYRLSDVEAIAANGNTILHLIVKYEDFTAQNKVEILEMLLDKSLNLRSKNQREEIVLHIAIETRARDVIDFLLERKVDLDNSAALFFIENEYNKRLQLKDQCDDEMQKRESESANFLDWMIARGLDIDRPDLYGHSALFSAIDYNLQHLLPVLLKYTKNIDYVGFETRRTILHIVLGNKAQTCWPPSYSQRYGTSIVKILLDRGVSPESVDTSLNTALHLAIADLEDINIVQMLIDHTKNVNHRNNKGDTPFLVAIRQWLRSAKPTTVDYKKICQALIMKGAVEDEGSQLESRPLHIFAKETIYYRCLEKEEIELFDMLISVGCNVNAKNSRGRTPLHLAAAGENKAVVQKLIESGAHINSRDDDGATPLHLAVCNGAGTKIAEKLIEHGANVNAKDCEGFTALHKAAGKQKFFSDDPARFEILLEHGADFCAQSDKGYSVLDMAVWKLNCSVVFDPEYNGKEPSLDEVSASSLSRITVSPNHELKFLLSHWVKLYAAELECDMGKNFDANTIADTRKFNNNCKKEVEILKNTFIDNNRTSFYDFLHMNVNSRRAHVHKEKLQQLVNSPSQLKIKKQFPRYAILIISSYNETIKRKSLMEPAKIAWIKLTKTHLGDLCIEHIFSFLSNAGLYNLIEASGIDYFR